LLSDVFLDREVSVIASASAASATADINLDW
jgi:hypothetical protein